MDVPVPIHRVSPDLGLATMSDHDVVQSGVRRLHLAVPRHDDVVHGALQMTLLGLLRAHAPDLATIEDLRLAVDEVLLGAAVVRGHAVALDLTLDDEAAEVHLVVDGHVEVPVDVLAALVDDVEVVRPAGATTEVRLTRSWVTGNQQ